MTEDEIAAALFSGEYDDLTVAEFAELFQREPRRMPTSFREIAVPVIDGIATLPDGRTVVSTAKSVRVAVPVFDSD